MGFHWEWLAIHQTEASLAIRLFEFTGFPAKRVLPGLTFEEALKLIDEYMSSRQDAAAACDFQGWTMVRGSALLAGKSIADAAKLFGADVCLAYAESTTWALGMEYGRPDGTLRSRTFVAAGDFKDVGVARVKDATGKVVGWDLAPKSLIGPDGTARLPGETQAEKTKGDPLAGELIDVVIADETNLLRVLNSLGVPIEGLEGRYGGTYDQVRKTVRSGPGAGEKVFTFYGLGDAPAPKQAQPPKSGTGGFLRRLFKG
jgi:hypothetical protein